MWKLVSSQSIHHFLAVLAWAETIPGIRTILREPIYFWHLWRDLKEVHVAHIFAASYWSFLLAPTPAWFFAKLRGKKNIINYHSGEARDHLRRFRSGKFVLSRVDEIVIPSGYLEDVFGEFGLKAIVVQTLLTCRSSAIANEALFARIWYVPVVSPSTTA